jgi:hypothetical protein
MWNFSLVNRQLKKAIIIIALFGGFSALAQKALDFGLGATISIGLQDEWAVHLKSQYHFNKKWSAFADYNLFFRRDVIAQNTENFHELGLGVNYQLFNIQTLEIYGGLGYLVNNFPIQDNNPDTSDFFITTGNSNHAAEIKFLGTLPIGDKIFIFSEINFKSFGKRYDTFSFGLIYRIEN